MFVHDKEKYMYITQECNVYFRKKNKPSTYRLVSSVGISSI